MENLRPIGIGVAWFGLVCWEMDDPACAMEINEHREEDMH